MVVLVGDIVVAVAAVEAETTRTKYSDDPIWLRINGLVFDDNSDSLTFSRRLARDNGWSHWFALEVINEYKKFLYLMYVAEHPVTPSIEVDQAWHLHMIYTRHYWEEFAKHMPFKPHHGPTKGGLKENEKYIEWYSKTLVSYKQTFNMNPPVNIWPDSSLRFRKGQTWQWVDTSQYLLLKNSVGYVLIIIGLLLFLFLDFSGH